VPGPRLRGDERKKSDGIGPIGFFSSNATGIVGKRARERLSVLCSRYPFRAGNPKLAIRTQHLAEVRLARATGAARSVAL